MLVIHRPRQHHDILRLARDQCEAAPGRGNIGYRPKQLPKPPDFDSQPHAMRFINKLRSEGTNQKRIPGSITRPCLAQGARERDQYRACHQ
jgi:hypothetical protein